VRDLSQFLLYSKGDPAAAEAILREGLEHSDEHAHLLYLLGVLRAMASDPNEAAVLFQRSLDADPHSLSARENLAGMLCELGQLAEGARHFELSLEQREDPETRLLLARALLGLERFEEARAHAGTAAELVPQSPIPWDLMAECARLLGHEGDAANCLQEAANRRLALPR
jgi:Flp pilus assembly protein TadD